MADHSVTISEEVRCFGGAPSNKWGDMLWNQNWGYGTLNTNLDVQQMVPESQASTDAIFQDVSQLISESQGSDDTILTSLLINVDVIDGGSISSSDSASSTKYDGVGYKYPAVVSTSYTQATNSSTNWTQAIPTSTTWDET
jgi:hypothetical protein